MVNQVIIDFMAVNFVEQSKCIQKVQKIQSTISTMNRGQRATRQNNPANNKQFVSGGVISNFTGATKLEQSDSVSPVQAAAAPVISSILVSKSSNLLNVAN